MAKHKCDIGKFKHRIVVETPNLTPDGMGGNTEVWTTFATVWAKLESKRAVSKWFAGNLEHRVTHRITLRYLPGIESNMRISYDSRIFQIHGILDIDEGKRFHELSTEEGSAS